MFKTKTLRSKTKTETKTQKMSLETYLDQDLSRHRQWPYFCEM